MLMSFQPSIELIMHEEVQKLLDNFAAILKVRTVFFAPDGTIMRCNRNSPNSSYCRIVQENLFGIGKCSSLDASKQQECIRNKSMISYRCHAGLREAIAPVIVENMHVGFILIGQFRTSKSIPRSVLKRCRNPQILAKTKKAFFELPFISPGQLKDVLAMFQMLVDYIVNRELVVMREDWMLEKINLYLNSHLTKPVRLPELARFVGRSISTVSHFLKEKYGKTFKQMLIEKRLDMADEMFKSQPELSIGEVAGMVGFEDRLYFSRIYRKYRKKTPSQFKLEK